MKFVKCCICGRLVEGAGNNAEPYKKGMCCNECNIKVVIPARQNQMLKKGRRFK